MILSSTIECTKNNTLQPLTKKGRAPPLYYIILELQRILFLKWFVPFRIVCCFCSTLTNCQTLLILYCQLIITIDLSNLSISECSNDFIFIGKIKNLWELVIIICKFLLNHFWVSTPLFPVSVLFASSFMKYLWCECNSPVGSLHINIPNLSLGTFR